MYKPIPTGLEKSNALKYVISKGWNWEGPTGGQIQIETCPYCKKGDHKLYMAVTDPSEDNRDGLHFCHHGSCQTTGNLRKLMEHCGDRVVGVDSRKEWAGGQKHDELPDVELCHAQLISDPEAMDYLLKTRGFSREAIETMKLGLKEKQYFRDAGEVRALVFPYLVNGNCVFAKYRTLPGSPKAFAAPTGWDAPLYNGEILTDKLREVIFVEGEANTVFLKSKGIHNVVGVPGANIRKAMWIETIDKLGDDLKKYILYDNDKAGNKGAQEIASRIGYDKCLKIVLPYFEVTVSVDQCKKCDDEGMIRHANKESVACEHKRPGKDVNEWFQSGNGSIEAFENLKRDAVLFDVTGVSSSGNALDEIEEDIEGKEDLAPTYVTQYEDFNRLVGFENGDVLDIVAGGKVGKTTFGLNLMDHMVNHYGEDGLVVCLEMTQKRLAMKWLGIVTGFEDNIVEPGSEAAKTKLTKLKDSIKLARELQKMRKADLYFAYPQGIKDIEDIFKLIRDCIRRYGVKWVMFDNIQLLCDTVLRGREKHRTVILSQISKGLTKIAKDLDVKMIRIVQPKMLEKGAVLESRDVDGSSQIEKDCDAQVLLWRKQLGAKTQSAFDQEMKQGEDDVNTVAFDPITKCTVSLSRYSSGGHCWFYFDGAKSQVQTHKLSKPKPAPLPQYNGIIPTEGAAIPAVVQTEVSTQIQVNLPKESQGINI